MNDQNLMKLQLLIKAQLCMINRFSKKYLLFLFFLTLVPIQLSAQKEVRKSIRKGNRSYQEQTFSDVSGYFNKALEENPS